MEEFILHPFLSTIISILLFIGCYELGKLVINRLLFKKIIESISILEFQYLTFGFVFLLIILFPLIAFANHAKILLQISGIVLIIFSINFFLNIKSLAKKIRFYQKNNFYYNIFVLYILLYFFLSLSPLTSADVLDYHAGTALNILRFNKYILLPEWFTSIQAGFGEVLISLGFALGAEQFGSMVQFSSLLAISGIILKFNKKKFFFKSNYFLILTILSCPILIFLLSGNKPQIFFSALIFIAFSLNFTNLKKEKDLVKIYFLINLFICCAVLGKFSFNLAGSLIWVFSTVNFFYKTKKIKILFIPVIIFLLVYLPFIYWKYYNLGGSLLTYLFSPFPLHLPGYETFMNHNKGSQEIPFPNFLFYTNLSRATEFLAANSIAFIILFFYSFKNKNAQIIIFISTIFILVANLYASPSARYYLDIILWLSLGILLLDNLKYANIIKIIFLPQIILVIFVLVYSTITFLPGAFSKNKYLKIKHNHAYMFSGIEWVNKNIPDESKIIIINRPIASYKNFAVSGNFNYFTTIEESKYYKNLIKKYQIDYLVYFGNKPDLRHLNNCVSAIYKKKDKVGFHATRNPFNRGSLYNAYIYKFNNEKLPDC